MLKIHLPSVDANDSIDLLFEHSLVSLSKWESIHEKPFFGKDEKTPEEALDYFRLMLLTENPPNGWIDRLTVDNFKALNGYIESKQTGTVFYNEQPVKPSRETISAEVVYYWMIELNIPFEPCENWHLNRLMTLIKVCSLKRAKPQKKSSKAAHEDFRRINEARRAALGSSG